MLLDHGRHGRERILSPASVDLMTTDQLTPEQRTGSPFVLGANRGWGFGVSVVTARDDVWATPGRYGWDGGYGTSWASDRERELIGIVLTQRLFDSPTLPAVHRGFWTCAYRAFEDRAQRAAREVSRKVDLSRRVRLGESRFRR
jgi:CubicO group peptidase (beta-lactamase class C family)